MKHISKPSIYRPLVEVDVYTMNEEILRKLFAGSRNLDKQSQDFASIRVLGV
jgi:hypothetical protein